MLLVRHGQTEWNAARRWQGHRDSPLTELGRREATACAELLASGDTPFSSIRTSSLGRAVATAEILSGRLGVDVVEPDDRWREAAAGTWEGMLLGEIEASYPGWLASGRWPDGFESTTAVVERAALALLDTAATDAGPVLIVTHGGVIRRLTTALGGVESRVPNLGGIWIDATLRSGPGSATGRHPAVGDVTRDLQLDRRFDGPTLATVVDRDDPRGQAE